MEPVNLLALNTVVNAHSSGNHAAKAPAPESLLKTLTGTKSVLPYMTNPDILLAEHMYLFLTFGLLTLGSPISSHASCY